MSQESADTYFTRLRSVNVGLGTSIDNKQKAKQLFVEAFQVLKAAHNSPQCRNFPKNPQIPPNNNNNLNNNFFLMELEILVKNMGVYFEAYKNTSDMLKGLVFLGNYVVYVNKNFAASFVPYLKYFAHFYAQFDCEESNYQTLALLAQVLEFLTKQQKENSENNVNVNNSEWMEKKTFVVKILQTDVEEIESEKRQQEMLKMLGVVLPHLARNMAKIKEYRLLNSLKVFILQNMKMANNNKKVMGELIYALSKIADSVKFNEKEILKYRTIETLVQLVEGQQSQLLLFGALKLLKVFWRTEIRRTAMIRQRLVQRLFKVYSIQPRLILSFIEEMFASEQQILLAEYPEFFSVLLETVQQSQSGRDDQVQNLIRVLYRGLGAQTGQVLHTLGQGLKDFLSKQFGAQSSQLGCCDSSKVTGAIQSYFSQMSYQVKQEEEQQFVPAPQQKVNIQQLLQANQIQYIQQQLAQQQQQVKQEHVEQQFLH